MGKKPILNKNGHFGKIPLSTTILPLMCHFKSLQEVFETVKYPIYISRNHLYHSISKTI